MRISGANKMSRNYVWINLFIIFLVCPEIVFSGVIRQLVREIRKRDGFHGGNGPSDPCPRWISLDY
jgi:hypothetical protein